jgi:hypothetical protein
MTDNHKLARVGAVALVGAALTSLIHYLKKKN